MDKIEALKQEIADLADQSEIRRKDIETARRIIDKVKSDLEMLPDVENPEEQRTTEEHGALDLEQRRVRPQNHHEV